jgi:beta-1,4-N-acetylglucosaminyltransferase
VARALLVCSTGGHLQQLFNLKPWWERQERLWVTFPKADALSLLAGEKVAWAHHPVPRNILNALRNLRLAWRLIRKWRPDVVVSNGSGVAVPFFLAARVLGVKRVYIEMYERIDMPTLSGRLCYPLSNLFLLQWEEQRRFYPRGQVVGTLL